MESRPVSADLRISVALVTRNGPERLRRCLLCLKAQTVQPWEVVVSDDSDAKFAGETRAVAVEFGARYLVGPHRGLYANRNQAALACKGTHIRTMDDDHEFPPDHFARCLTFLEQDPGAIWTTGEQGYIDRIKGAFADNAKQLHPCGLGCDPEDLDDNWAIADGSTFYPAAVFQRGFRMLEQFGYGSSYLEFGALLRKHGFRSRCIPGVMIDHYMEPEAKERHSSFSRSKAESCLYASLAYNFYFRPSLLRALRYTATTLWANRKAPGLIFAIPSMLRHLSRRWRREPLTSRLIRE